MESIIKAVVFALVLVIVSACDFAAEEEGKEAPIPTEDVNGPPDDVGGVDGADAGDTGISEDTSDIGENDTANDATDISEPEDTGCTPVCEGKECGDDGCGGSCGQCDGNDVCIEGECTLDLLPNPEGENCSNGVDDDNDGMTDCDDDGCSGTIVCAECINDNDCALNFICKKGACVEGCYSDADCSMEKECIDGLCEVIVCSPQCDGMECGPDGCGGVCGTCVSDDVCISGFCEPAPACSTNAHCNDGNVCTTDTCVGGQCLFTANNVTCDDGSACTEEDVCVAGVCQGLPLDCADGNPCTNDTCDPASGCVFTNNTASCDDGNACTQNDKCSGGQCQPGNPLQFCKPCNSGAECAGFSYCGGPNSIEPTGACTGGKCVMETVNCDDGNPNTLDACVVGTGCSHTPVPPSCGDGVCNGAETCSSCPGDCGVCPTPTFPHPKGTIVKWCYANPQSDWRGVAALGGTDSQDGWKSVADIVLDGNGCAVLVTDVSATTIFVDGVYVPIGKTSWEKAQWFAATKPPISMSVNGVPQAVSTYQEWKDGQSAGYEAVPGYPPATL